MCLGVTGIEIHPGLQQGHGRVSLHQLLPLQVAVLRGQQAQGCLARLSPALVVVCSFFIPVIYLYSVYIPVYIPHILSQDPFN